MREPRPGDPISAGHTRRTVRAARKGSRLSVSGADLSQAGGTTSLRMGVGPQIVLAELTSDWTIESDEQATPPRQAGWHYADAKLWQFRDGRGWAATTRPIRVWWPSGYGPGILASPRAIVAAGPRPGDLALVARDSGTGLYLLLGNAQGTLFHFELDEGEVLLPAPDAGTALANILDWSIDGGGWALPDEPSTIRVLDAGGMWPGFPLRRGWAQLRRHAEHGAVGVIVAADREMIRFEMTAALACGNQAEAYWLSAEAGPYDEETKIVVWDRQRRHSKMETAEGDGGARGLAQYMPDGAGSPWEIVSMQNPGDFLGALEDDMGSDDETATVAVVAEGGVFEGYNPFQVNHGNTIVAHNRLGLSGAAGDRVFCKWHVWQARYEILVVSPNEYDWQELDVVVGVDFGAETVTKKRIRLPPWTTIEDV